MIGWVWFQYLPYIVAKLMTLSPSLCSYLTILTHAPWDSTSTVNRVGVNTLQSAGPANLPKTFLNIAVFVSSLRDDMHISDFAAKVLHVSHHLVDTLSLIHI